VRTLDKLHDFAAGTRLIDSYAGGITHPAEFEPRIDRLKQRVGRLKSDRKALIEGLEFRRRGRRCPGTMSGPSRAIWRRNGNGPSADARSRGWGGGARPRPVAARERSDVTVGLAGGESLEESMVV